MNLACVWSALNITSKSVKEKADSYFLFIMAAFIASCYYDIFVLWSNKNHYSIEEYYFTIIKYL